MSTPTLPQVYQTVFVKKNGQDRKIRYIAMDDLAPFFVAQEIKGTGSKKTGPRSSLVWDMDAQAFRTINLDTIKQTPAVCGYALLFESEPGKYKYIFRDPASTFPCTN